MDGPMIMDSVPPAETLPMPSDSRSVGTTWMFAMEFVVAKPPAPTPCTKRNMSSAATVGIHALSRQPTPRMTHPVTATTLRPYISSSRAPHEREQMIATVNSRLAMPATVPVTDEPGMMDST